MAKRSWANQLTMRCTFQYAALSKRPAPRRDGGGRPPGHLFQSVSAGVHRLYEDQPAKNEAMATTPHGGQAAQHARHKTREVGEGHHHAQRHLQRGYEAKNGRRKSTLRLSPFSVDLQGLDGLGVNSEYVTSNSIAQEATLCLACGRCARTRRTPGRPGVSLEKCPDAGAANCVGVTRTLPWYSHALHKSHRHLHPKRTHPYHG